MDEAREILRVFCWSRSAPGKVAWKAAGISREATETVIIDAEVWETRLLYRPSFRRSPPKKKHIPRISRQKMRRRHTRRMLDRMLPNIEA
jgi:hypothetical protein